MKIEQEDIVYVDISGFDISGVIISVVDMTLEEFHDTCSSMNWSPEVYMDRELDYDNEYAFPDTDTMAAWYTDNTAYFYSR